MATIRAEPVAASSAKKIVFVAGRPSHSPGEHEHRAGSMLLADQLNKSGLPVDAVVTTDGWPKDNSIFVGASAVFIYADGVGIGCIHCAVEIPKGEPGNAFLDLTGGHFHKNWQQDDYRGIVLRRNGGQLGQKRQIISAL